MERQGLPSADNISTKTPNLLSRSRDTRNEPTGGRTAASGWAAARRHENPNEEIFEPSQKYCSCWNIQGPLKSCNSRTCNNCKIIVFSQFPIFNAGRQNICPKTYEKTPTLQNALGGANQKSSHRYGAQTATSGLHSPEELYDFQGTILGEGGGL